MSGGTLFTGGHYSFRHRDSKGEMKDPSARTLDTDCVVRPKYNRSTSYNTVEPHNKEPFCLKHNRKVDIWDL